MTKKKQDGQKEEKKEYGTPNDLNRISKQGRRIRIQFDIDYQGDPGKTPKGTSQTVPDMNLTVRQLLENHTRGRNSEVTVQQPLYFETEIPTIRDITDVDKYKEHLQERLEEVNRFIKNEKAEEEKKAKDEAEKQNKTSSQQLDIEKEADKASK